ncbi:MAG: hypothetical protein R2849_07440 [Thermomicrobiales bacterium]
MTISDAPTSAKMACQRVARPKTARMRTAALIARAMAMFWMMMPLVRREFHHARQLAEIVAHQGHVSGLQCGVGSGRTHGDADRRAGQGRGVVDAVADHPDALVTIQQTGHGIDLLVRQQLGFDRIDPDVAGDDGRDFGAIAGQHDRLLDAGSMDRRNGVAGSRPDLVGHGEDAIGFSVDR